MKKLSLFLIVLVSCTTLFAQQRTRSFMGWHLAKDAPIKRNELKLNVGSTIFGLFPEVSYERIISEDFSIGGSAGINLSDEYTLQYTITPYARWFFGGNSTSLQKYGAGFFMELNAAVFGNEDYDRSYSDYGTDLWKAEYNLGAGVGLAIGWKYISRNNWIAEVYMGAGRDFVNDSAYPRGGITLGKRF